MLSFRSKNKILFVILFIFILISLPCIKVHADTIPVSGCQYDSHGSLVCTIDKPNDSSPEHIYGVPASSQTGFIYAVRLFYQEYRLVLNAFIGITVLTNILIMIYHFCNLAKVATSPKERSRVLNNILITGICLAILGGSSLIYILLVTL